MSGDRTDRDRERDRRESLIWIILAGLGTAVPLGIVFISSKHLTPRLSVNEWIEFVVFSAVLIAAIPFAVKVNREFDLPGGPLITATIYREPKPYRWREVLIASVLWTLIALTVLMIALFVVDLVLIFFPSFGPRIMPHRTHRAQVVKPSAIWLASGVVAFAVLAGVQEEILFRFVLVGVLSWALMTISRAPNQRPNSRQLWLANIVQAYFFALAHRISDFHAAKGVIGVAQVAIRSLVRPQTFGGLFLGWLYLRDGLETAMVSHTFIDLLISAITLAARYGASSPGRP
jgi:membrane protease YdiL (CAAX protease family)